MVWTPIPIDLLIHVVLFIDGSKKKRKEKSKSAQALKMSQSTIIVMLEIQDRKVAYKNTINITTAVPLSWFHHAANPRGSLCLEPSALLIQGKTITEMMMKTIMSSSHRQSYKKKCQKKQKYKARFQTLLYGIQIQCMCINLHSPIQKTICIKQPLKHHFRSETLCNFILSNVLHNDKKKG